MRKHDVGKLKIFFCVNYKNMARLTFEFDLYSIMWQQSSSDQLDDRK